MSFITIVVCILACVYVAELKSFGVGSNGVGHYWRDYEGHIPSDALEIAPNTYVGQVFANGFIKPAHINALKKQAEYVHNGRAYTTHHEIKILCSTDPSQFEWVKTDKSNIMRLLPTRNIIPGGYSENDKPFLIGRSHDNHIVGMVTVYSEDDGFQYPLNGEAIYDNEFDVYIYKNN